jgi:hypothetical protein
MVEERASEKKPVHVPRLVERRERLRTFISPAVLTRLENREFQPLRQAQEKESDLRESKSPLALSKRSIRFQPAVFRDRHKELLHMARFLNQPYSKVFTLIGKQGVGKLSLLRALAELLEPRYAELLWFEVPSYGDSVELALLMLKQIDQLAEGRTPEEQGQEAIPPALWEAHTVEARQRLFERLRPRLKSLKATPTLIVVNGLDALLNRPQQSLQAPAFVEVLNFLLSFDSFKLALAGEHNCVDVLEVSPQGLKTFSLDTFTPQNPFKDPCPEDLAELLRTLQALPWLWQAMVSLEKRHPALVQEILEEGRVQQGENTPNGLALSDCLRVIAFVSQRHLEAYGVEAISLLALLSVMRQPFNLQTLAYITQTELSSLTHAMKHPLFKTLLRFTVNPHTLASRLKQATISSKEDTQTPFLVELYHDIQPYFKQWQAVELQRYWHHRLGRFYEEEAQKTPKQRLLIASDTIALEREARFHYDTEKALESTRLGTDPSQPTYGSNALGLGKSSGSPPRQMPPLLDPLPPKKPQTPTVYPSPASLRKDAKVKGSFSASFGENPPIEPAPRLPEHERRAAVASMGKKEPATLVNPPATEGSPKDLSRPYAQALLELATLYTHLNNLPALEQTLKALKPFHPTLPKATLAELTLRHVMVETHHHHLKQAVVLLEGFFQGMIAGQYPEEMVSSALLRLLDVHEKGLDLFQYPSVGGFLRAYFQENHAFLSWQGAPSQPHTLSDAEKTQRVIWAKALSLYVQWPELPVEKQTEARGLRVRAFLEAGAFVQAIEALHDLAEHFIKRAQPEKALLCLKKAETLDAYHERPTLQWKTQQQMALTLWELGHPKDAVQRLKVVLQHAEAHEDAYWQASTLFLIGELAFDSLNGVEWALNCMEKALAFGETVLGSERYRAFRQRKRQVEEELTHEHPHTSEPHPLKHTPNSPQSVGWKRRTPRKLPY